MKYFFVCVLCLCLISPVFAQSYMQKEESLAWTGDVKAQTYMALNDEVGVFSKENDAQSFFWWSLVYRQDPKRASMHMNALRSHINSDQMEDIAQASSDWLFAHHAGF